MDNPHAMKRKRWNLNKVKMLYEEGLYLTALKIEYVFSIINPITIKLSNNCLTSHFVNKLFCENCFKPDCRDCLCCFYLFEDYDCYLLLSFLISMNPKTSIVDVDITTKIYITTSENDYLT